MRIYVASSWRNPYQPNVVALCREAGHEAYDFRNPKAGDIGFSWKQIDSDNQAVWSFERYREILSHPIAEEGFRLDFDAMKWADACLMVLPCGRSAHLELGWCAGANKRTAVLYPVDVPLADMPGHRIHGGACPGCGDLDGCWLPNKLRRDFEPELMVKVADALLIGRAELSGWLKP